MCVADGALRAGSSAPRAGASAARFGEDDEVAAALRAAFIAEVGGSKGKWPGQLRLIFHDAGTYDRETKTGGPNGSIAFELDRPESKVCFVPAAVSARAGARTWR